VPDIKRDTDEENAKKHGVLGGGSAIRKKTPKSRITAHPSVTFQM
jgi:hypothetical protein